jgi:hypothetical protein
MPTGTCKAVFHTTDKFSSDVYSAFGLSIVGTIGTILSTMGPADPIVVPIVASVVIAKWVHEVYQRS